MMKKLYTPVLIVVIFLLASCAGKPTEFTYEVKTLKFRFEPPYAGSDTKSAEAVLDLEEIFKANQANMKDIRKVTLEDITVVLDNQENFDKVTNFTLELQGDKAPTITVANLPVVPPGSKILTFKGSDKKDADKHFREGKFYVLLSANFQVEDSSVYEMTASLKFKVAAGATK